MEPSVQLKLNHFATTDVSNMIPSINSKGFYCAKLAGRA